MPGGEGARKAQSGTYVELVVRQWQRALLGHRKLLTWKGTLDTAPGPLPSPLERPRHLQFLSMHAEPG